MESKLFTLHRLVSTAIENDDAVLLRFLLKQYSYKEKLYNITDELGGSLLHQACRLQHANVVRVLLENSFHTDWKDNLGDTALHIAASRGCEEIILSLVEAKADATVLNDNGLRASDLCSCKDIENILEDYTKKCAEVQSIRDSLSVTKVYASDEESIMQAINSYYQNRKEGTIDSPRVSSCIDHSTKTLDSSLLFEKTENHQTDSVWTLCSSTETLSSSSQSKPKCVTTNEHPPFESEDKNQRRRPDSGFVSDTESSRSSWISSTSSDSSSKRSSVASVPKTFRTYSMRESSRKATPVNQFSKLEPVRDRASPKRTKSFTCKRSLMYRSSPHGTKEEKFISSRIQTQPSKESCI